MYVTFSLNPAKMDILSQIVPSVNFFVATIAKRLQEYKRKFIYLSKTANIIILSYILLKILAVKHATPLKNITYQKYLFHVLNY